MSRVLEITDPGDPLLADYQDLTDVALRMQVEPEHGIFIGEGELVIRRALRAGYRMRSALMSHRWHDALDLSGFEGDLYVATDEVLEQVTGFHVHRGALASFARRPLPTRRSPPAPPKTPAPTNHDTIVIAAGAGDETTIRKIRYTPVCPARLDYMHRLFLSAIVLVAA